MLKLDVPDFRSLMFEVAELDELTDLFSDEELAEKFSVDRATITYWRRKLNVKSYTEKFGKNKGDCYHTLDKTHGLTRDLMIELTSQFSDKEIAQKYNVSRTSIQRHRARYNLESFTKKTNIVKRNGLEYGRGKLRVKTEGDVAYFDNINTHDKAYFLGFIAADGTISSNLSHATIGIQKKDASLLEDFILFSDWHTPVHYHPTLNKAVLSLSSQHLVSKLVEWGITPRKSKTLELKKEIPLKFQADFVRGVWDGDGHICETNFSLVSASKVFLEQIQQMIYSNTGILLPIHKPNNDNPYHIQGGGTTMKAIQWIYSRTTPGLQRKAIQVSRYWS